MSKHEKFKFTADNIGSEVLERFSNDIYQPRAILRELIKNAYDSYFELEGFLEESTHDAAYDPEKKVVRVTANQSTIIISDDGLGLDKDGISKLLSIALTAKRDVDGVTGFRGIGFWSAYTAGETITVTSTRLGSDREFTLFLHTDLMRQRQGPNVSIGAIMNDPECIKLESAPAEPSAHYTRLAISASSAQGRLHDLANNPDLLRKQLIESCSYALDASAPSAAHLKKFYHDRGVQPASLHFQSKELLKGLPDGLSSPTVRPLNVVLGGKTTTVAWLWFCTNKANKAIDSPLPGIWLYKDGFPVGDSNIYSKRSYNDSHIEVTRADILNWHIGEVHVCHSELTPEASGEGLVYNSLFVAFRESLREFYQKVLIVESHGKANAATLAKKYRTFNDKAEEALLQAKEGEEVAQHIIDDLKRARTLVDDDNKKARGKLKQGTLSSSRASYVRTPEAKKERGVLSSTLKKLEKHGVSLDSRTRPGKKKKSKKKTSAKPRNSSPSAAGSSRDAAGKSIDRSIVLAFVDELRDLVIDTLADDQGRQDELLDRINSVVARFFK